MTAKKYVISLISILYIFFAVNLSLWYCCTKKFFTQRDLNRLGSYYTTSDLTGLANYQRHHEEFTAETIRNLDAIKLGSYHTSTGLIGSADYQRNHEKFTPGTFDIITIGDSFSQGGYQDYFTDKLGMKVLNINMTGHCLNDIYKLISSGIIDELKPKAIILESVERSVQNRLGMTEIIPVKISREEVLRRISRPQTSENISRGIFPPIMMKTNIKFLRDIFYRIINPEQLSPKVYINQLAQYLFTNPGQENLFMHYHEDLNYLSQTHNPEMINRNLNNAAKLLAEKNITLFFMPCADKYDLYYTYLKDKHGRPENPFFDEMRRVQPKNYIFIDTKAILRKALERGDTHWSWKGMERVSEEIAKYLLP